MKKIINGKSYDTETAKNVGCWSNNLSYRDFSWVEETLYRKKTGEYFLHGEGGPASRYSVATGINSWSGGERIMPMTYAEASEWAAKHLDGDDYEAIFGAVVEDESKRTVAYSLTVGAIEKLRRMSEEQGRSASEILDAMIMAAR